MESELIQKMEKCILFNSFKLYNGVLRWEPFNSVEDYAQELRIHLFKILRDETLGLDKSDERIFGYLSSSIVNYCRALYKKKQKIYSGFEFTEINHNSASSTEKTDIKSYYKRLIKIAEKRLMPSEFLDFLKIFSLIVSDEMHYRKYVEGGLALLDSFSKVLNIEEVRINNIVSKMRRVLNNGERISGRDLQRYKVLQKLEENSMRG